MFRRGAEASAPTRRSWGIAVAGALICGLLVAAQVSAGRAQAQTTVESNATFLARLAQAAAAIGPDEVNNALLPATQDDTLPDGYVPPDLVSLATVGFPQRGGAYLRRVVLPDLQDLLRAARE